MERTRLRELTHSSRVEGGIAPLCRNGAYPIKGIDTVLRSPFFLSYLQVEMERTRLRELTRIYIHTISFWLYDGRNGAYPIKGIDTVQQVKRRKLLKK